eukprot:4834427-Pleurochrysis_carterae.AAC.1
MVIQVCNATNSHTLTLEWQPPSYAGYVPMAIPGSPYSMGTYAPTFHANNDISITFLAPLPETNNFTVSVTPHYFAGADITCS